MTLELFYLNFKHLTEALVWPGPEQPVRTSSDDVLWSLVGHFRGNWDGDVYHTAVFTSVGGAVVSSAVRQNKCAVGAILPVMDWSSFLAPRDLQRAR